MVDEDLEIIEVTLTVVAPWSLQYLLEIWMLPLVVLAHDEERYDGDLSAGGIRLCIRMSDDAPDVKTGCSVVEGVKDLWLRK